MTKLLKAIIFLVFAWAAYTNPYAIYNDYVLETSDFHLTAEKVGTWKENTLIRDVVYIHGSVGINDCENISPFITENSILILNSPGGAYLEGLCLGDRIREMNARTYVSSEPVYVNAKNPIWSPEDEIVCASACAHMFMAGKERTLKGDVLFGIHNAGLPAPALFNANPYTVEHNATTGTWELVKAFNRWSVPRNDTFREVWFTVPNTDMHWFHPRDFEEIGLPMKLVATTYIDFYGYSDD